MSLHINGAERARRTKILTSATTDASLRVDSRYFGGVVIAGHGIDHYDGPHRTMACAVAAVDTIGHHHTIFFDPNGMTNLN